MTVIKRIDWNTRIKIGMRGTVVEANARPDFPISNRLAYKILFDKPPFSRRDLYRYGPAVYMEPDEIGQNGIERALNCLK